MRDERQVQRFLVSVREGRELERNPPVTVSNKTRQELDDLGWQAQTGKDEHRRSQRLRAGQ